MLSPRPFTSSHHFLKKQTAQGHSARQWQEWNCIECSITSKYAEALLVAYGGGGALVAKSCPTLVTPQTTTLQVPLSMGFSRQEYWNGLPFPSPGDLPNPGIEPGSPALQADSLLTELQAKPGSLQQLQTRYRKAQTQTSSKSTFYILGKKSDNKL